MHNTFTFSKEPHRRTAQVIRAKQGETELLIPPIILKTSVERGHVHDIELIKYFKKES